MVKRMTRARTRAPQKYDRGRVIGELVHLDTLTRDAFAAAEGAAARRWLARLCARVERVREALDNME